MKTTITDAINARACEAFDCLARSGILKGNIYSMKRAIETVASDIFTHMVGERSTVSERVELSMLRSEAAELATSGRPNVQRLARELAWAVDEIERLRGLLLMPEWRPMDMAPRDGTTVVVSFEVAEVRIAHLAWYRSEQEWADVGQYCGGWERIEDWLGWWTYVNPVSQVRLEGTLTPTAWMPAP